MSTINEQIVTGRAHRVLIDKVAKLWQRISFWTKASDVEFNDGNNAETKVGAIKGITTDLNTTETGYAADMTALAQLNSDLGGFEPIINETGKITGYKTTVGGADTVFPFSEIDRLELIHALANSGLGLTENSMPAQIYAALATKFPPTKSWIVPGWSLGGNPAASSIHSGNDYIQMTIYASGYGSMITYMNSPTIDITTFKTLSITGQGKRSTGNPTEGYQPKLYLVNASNGSSTLLFKGTSGQFSGPTIDTINVNYNVSSLSGNYLLRGEITNYEDGQNNGAYIYLTKALLSA